MALRKIVFEGDPQLNKISREITEVNDRILTLLDDLLDTMHEENGVTIADPDGWRIVLMNTEGI